VPEIAILPSQDLTVGVIINYFGINLYDFFQGQGYKKFSYVTALFGPKNKAPFITLCYAVVIKI
jgi:hypothetical protein